MIPGAPTGPDPQQPMPRTSTYLNFCGTTEAAFSFYRSVFGTDFPGEPMRMRDVPGASEMSEEEGNQIMHVMLPILGGHVLMGTDVPASMQPGFVVGTNVSINLEPDTREEAERLFAALSEGGEVSMPLQEMFWGGYYGAFTDKFGISWMMNCESKT